MADLTRKIMIEVLGDDKGGSRALNSAGQAADGLHGKFSKLGKVVSGVFAAFAAGYVVKEVGGFLIDAAKAAVEDAASQSKLATVVQNVTGATTAQVAAMEAWITKTQMATGISDSNLRPALQNLVVATKSVSEAQGLMGVAMDISVAKGLDLETVTKAMQKAHDGNTGALSKLGIATKDAEGKTLSFQQIMANASETFGGSAATAADTLAGKTARIGEMFGEAKESLGAVFLPVLEQFMGWVTANMPAIQATFETAFAAIGAAINWISTNVVPVVMEAFRLLKEFIVNDVAPALTSAWNGLKDWWNQYGPAIATLVRGVEDAARALVGYWVDNWKRIKQAVSSDDPSSQLSNLASVLGAVVTAAAKVIGWFQANWSTIGPIVSGGIELALLPLSRFISLINAVKSAAEAAISAISRLVGAQNNYTQTHSQQGGPGGTAAYGHPRAMAAGGIVTRPTFALIGEAGPEAVIPLGRRGQGSKGLGSITVNNYITGARIEGEAAGDATVRRLQAMMA